MKRTRNNYKEMAKEKHVGTLEGLRIVSTVKLGAEPFEGAEDPINSFYGQICDKLGVEKEGFEVSKVAVSQATAEAYNAEIIKWMRKSGVRAAKFEYEYGMVHLCYVPRVCSDVEDGVAHIVEWADEEA